MEVNHIEQMFESLSDAILIDEKKKISDASISNYSLSSQFESEKYCGIEAVWEAFEHVDDTPYGEL